MIARDWISERDNLQDFTIGYSGHAILAESEYQFPKRPNLYVDYYFANNVLTIPKLNPGEWLDLTVLHSIHDEAEKIRRNFTNTSSEYFTPRIVNASSEDGKAIVLHHARSCLQRKYMPINDTWRFHRRS